VHYRHSTRVHIFLTFVLATYGALWLLFLRYTNTLTYLLTYIDTTWQIRLNRLCAAAMRPYVKLFWQAVLHRTHLPTPGCSYDSDRFQNRMNWTSESDSCATVYPSKRNSIRRISIYLGLTLTTTWNPSACMGWQRSTYVQNSRKITKTVSKLQRSRCLLRHS